MKNVIEVINLYADVNSSILESEEHSCKLFKRFTHSLLRFNKVLSKVYLKMELADIKLLRETQ